MSNSTLITFVANKKLKSLIENHIKDIKDKFHTFYSLNIGEIDKVGGIDLEEYIVNQHKNPLGTATIKLKNNFYILQKDLGNEYLYIPFQKTTSAVIPFKDERKMTLLKQKYGSYKPIRKKELLERIYNCNIEKIKKEKISKQSFFNSPVLELSSKLDSIGIYDLSEALNFYKPTTIVQKRISPKLDKEIIENSLFYKEYLNIIDNQDNLETHELYEQLSSLITKVSDSVNYNTSLIEKDKNLIDSRYLKVLENEDIVCTSIPNAEFILDRFFETTLDTSRIKQDIKNEILIGELKSSFSFFKACKNLSEVVSLLNGQNYVRSLNNKGAEFAPNQKIMLNQ